MKSDEKVMQYNDEKENEGAINDITQDSMRQSKVYTLHRHYDDDEQRRKRKEEKRRRKHEKRDKQQKYIKVEDTKKDDITVVSEKYLEETLDSNRRSKENPFKNQNSHHISRDD
jgi:O-methyltransferase involved in polyketide biosynthesis